MLQTIRDRTHGWFAGIIIFVLILSFALWGISSYFSGGSSSNVVAKVNGVVITKNQLAATFERMQRQLMTQYGVTNAALSGKIETHLKEQALQSLITVQALKQASIDQGYRISSVQVDNYMASIPDFRVNGQFSMERFQQILTSTMLSVQEFLDLVATNLLIDQPRLGMIFTSFALPNEITETYSLVEQTRDIQYAMLPFDQSLQQKITVPENQMQAYYQQHENEFHTPEQVSISYLQLSANDLIAKIQPTESALMSYYNDNLASYGTLVHGKSVVQPYAQVKNKVRETYLHQQAEEKFAELKEKLANLTYEHPDTLDTAAKELNLSIKKSALFTREKGNKDITADNKIRTVAFSNDVLAQQNNSDVIQLNPDTLIVLRVNSHVPATLLPIKAVQKQIENKLKAIAIDAQTLALAQQIAVKLQQQSISDVTQQYHLKWNELGLIGRHSVKVDSAILNSAFGMPMPNQDKPNFSIAKVPGGYAVIALKAIKQGSLDTKNHSQYVVFAEQFQNTQGLLEYELYKQSQLGRSKIVIQ